MKKILLIMILSWSTVFAFTFRFSLFSNAQISTFGSAKAWSNGTYATSCDGYRNPNKNNYQYVGTIWNWNYLIKPVGVSFPYIVYCDMTSDPLHGYTRLNLNQNGNVAISEYVNATYPTGSLSRLGISAGTDTNALNGSLVGFNSLAPLNGGCGKNSANTYAALQLSSYIYSTFNPTKVMIIGKSYTNSGAYSECGGFFSNMTNGNIYGTGYSLSGIIGSCTGTAGSKYSDLVGTNSQQKQWEQDVPAQGNPFITPYNDCGKNSPINYYQVTDILIR